MKKKLGILAALGMGLAAVAIWVGSAAWAQQTTRQAAPAGASSGGGRNTRIALVNLQEVLKNYKKFESVRAQLRQKAEYWDTTLKNKAKRLQEYEDQYKKAPADQKDKIEREMRAIRVEIDNIRQDARKELGKYEQEQIAQIYREVDDVVQRVAREYSYDLVLRYNDLSGTEGQSDAAIVARLSQTFWPMYHDKNMEITNYVASQLNAKYGSGASAPATNNGTRIQQTNFPKQQPPQQNR